MPLFIPRKRFNTKKGIINDTLDKYAKNEPVTLRKFNPDPTKVSTLDKLESEMGHSFKFSAKKLGAYYGQTWFSNNQMIVVQF